MAIVIKGSPFLDVLKSNFMHNCAPILDMLIDGIKLAAVPF